MNRDDRKTVPCETCGKPTTYIGTNRCSDCYEVESRLDSFLHNKKGILIIIEKLREHRLKRDATQLTKEPNKEELEEYASGLKQTLDSDLKRARSIVLKQVSGMLIRWFNEGKIDLIKRWISEKLELEEMTLHDIHYQFSSYFCDSCENSENGKCGSCIQEEVEYVKRENIKNDLYSKLRKAARNKYPFGGVEIENDARVSTCDYPREGAWIQAWMWVNTDEAKISKDDLGDLHIIHLEEGRGNEISFPTSTSEPTRDKNGLIDYMMTYFGKEENAGELDDLVCDLARKLGSSINDAGPEEQLRFLLREYNAGWITEQLMHALSDLI